MVNGTFVKYYGYPRDLSIAIMPSIIPMAIQIAMAIPPTGIETSESQGITIQMQFASLHFEPVTNSEISDPTKPMIAGRNAAVAPTKIPTGSFTRNWRFV